MERFKDLIESLNDSPTNDVSALLGELRKASPGKHVADVIAKLDGIIRNNIGERKRAEAALKEVVSCYRRLEQSIPGMVFEHVVQPDGRSSFRYVAETSLNLFGISPGEVLSDERNLFNLEHPDDRDRSREFIRQTINTLQPGRIDLRHIINGELRWFEIIVHPNLGPNGEVIVDGIAIEITDRKQAEEALREREERLRISNEAARIGTYGTNLEADRVYWSPELCDILGVPHGTERTQETAFKVVHADDLRRVLAESTRGMDPDGDGRFSSEHRIVRPDGQERWVLWRGRTIFRESASGPIPSKRIGACVDITERKKMDIALQESEQKYRALVESAQPIIFIVDENGVFQLSEGQGLAKLGLQPGQIVGQSVFEMYKDVSSVLEGIRIALDGKTNRRVCVVGDVIFDTVYSPYFTGNGQQSGVVGIALDITERTRAEAIVRNQKERLALALQGADLGSWDWSIPTGEVIFNARWAEMLGYSLEEIRPHITSWETLVNPEDMPRVRQLLTAHLEGRTPFYDTEHRLLHKSGSWVWVLAKGKVIERDVEGRPTRMAGTQLDISERKRAQQALERRMVALTQPLDTVGGIAMNDLFNLSDIQHLQNLFARACGVATFITSPDGAPITQPSNFTPLCGEIIRNTEKGLTNCKHSDAIIGRYNLSGPNIQTCLSAGLCNAGACISVDGHHIANWVIGQVRDEKQDEEKMMGYAREIGADEESFRAAFRKVPVMPQEQFNNVAHFLFALANQISNTAYQNIQQARFISERKRAEETLRKYERIVSTAHDQMILVNRDYVYEVVNESFLKAHKKQREQIMGRKAAEVVGERLFRTKIRSRLDQALSGKTVNYQESINFAAIGHRIMDVTYLPLFDESGKVEGVVLNYRDITETRNLEKQLIQSQRLEAIGTLAGGVAHEINNPINGVMNYAQLIVDRSIKGSPTADLAVEIIRETERISGIVRNLLTFSRHEKQPYCQACMSDIVSSVLSLTRTLIRLDRIDLEVDIEEGLPQLKCRSQEIQQVLMNLMTNARDALNQRYQEFDSEKKIRISIRLIGKRSKKLIRTTVEDNGIGIRPAIRDRIFDPFFTTKSKGVGTGLGLSISYGIVKDHGGDLIMESNPGEFTRFHMDLPTTIE